MTELDPASPAPEESQNQPPHNQQPPNLFEPQPKPPVIEHSPDPGPPARRGGTPLPLTLLIAAGLAGAGYYGWTHPAPETLRQGASDDAPLHALAARIDTLEHQPQPSPDATTDLAKRVDDLTGRVAALSTKQDQIAAQADKLGELMAQKNITPSAPPPPDATAQEAPALAAGQQAEDARAIDDKLAQQKSALDQAQSGQKAAMAALADRLAKLEQAPTPAVAPNTDALDALTRRLGKLEQAAAQAQQQTDSAQKAQSGDAESLAALGARIGKLEQGAGQTAGAAHDATRAIHLAAAEAALAAGEPLGRIAGAPAALQKFATTPPPTEAALRAAFPDLAARARAASVPANEHRSFLDRLLARAQQSVVVRQGDHVIVGDPAAGTLTHAQDQVAAGDLKGAMQTLSVLQGPAAAALHDWMAQAQALLDARAALADLAAHS